MIVVTVARRPLGLPTVAQNVLMHGVGALNIDHSRIAPIVGETVGPGSYSDPNNRVGAVGATAFVSQRDVGKMAEAQAASVERSNRLGRWPSNLLLGHMAGCVCVGEKTVKGSHDTTGVWGHNNTRTETYGGGWRKGQGDAGRTRGHTQPDGTETVAAWNCAPNCPVAALDDQSGLQKSGVAVNRNRPPGTMTSWLGTRASQVGEDVGFGDVGGASRYFKQLGSKS